MASRFWVGGTGTWDGVTTTHWAATTGAAGGASVPGSADTVTFDGASGGGVVTVNTTVTVQSITNGAHTGTLDFSVNNNNVNLSASTGLNASGAGVRTLNLGNGTWTFTGVGSTIVNIATKTNLTLNTNSATFLFTATTASMRQMSLASTQNLPAISVSANSGGGSFVLPSSVTYASVSVTAPNCIVVGSATTTITGAMTINGISLSALVLFVTDSPGFTATISSANNGTFTYCAFRDMAFIGGGTFTATNSIDLGHNTSITITPPSAGGGLAPAPIVIGRGTPY